MSLELSEAARAFVASEGYDPVYGARPLKRFISHEVETRIGRALLAGDVEEGSVIRLDVRDEELVVTWHGSAGADEPVEPRETVGAPG
jgi:ATP-dependent Clp protease ATP-binding subunit ClpB